MAKVTQRTKKKYGLSNNKDYFTTTQNTPIGYDGWTVEVDQDRVRKNKDSKKTSKTVKKTAGALGGLGTAIAIGAFLYKNGGKEALSYLWKNKGKIWDFITGNKKDQKKDQKNTSTSSPQPPPPQYDADAQYGGKHGFATPIMLK